MVTMTSQENPVEWGEHIAAPHTDEQFSFVFAVNGERRKLTATVHLPLASIAEFAYRLIASHSLPCYLENDLIESLRTFVELKTSELHAHTTDKLFKSIQNSDTRTKIVNQWSALWQEGTKSTTYNKNAESVQWSSVYHSLIHSPALEQVLRLEHGYAVAIKDLTQERDEKIILLRDRHDREMEEMIGCVGTTRTDDDVNRLSTRHLEESQMEETFWSSALTELQETQKKEYRQWVVSVHEQMTIDPTFTPSLLTPLRPESDIAPQNEEAVDQTMEESFTIHLGNQMKSMHNIRLISRDVLDYCRCRTSFVDGTMVLHPQRLQTAMSLYSASLSALVLLVDDRLALKKGIKQNFHAICCESTDFHFPHLDKQMCVIEESLASRPVRTRTLRTSSVLNNGRKPNKTNNLLQTGDFYMTRHSNLSEVHCVFHLVSDESVTSALVNSRHPIMTGLRNIMMAAARHNINNLVIPLLLVHEMSENLTVQWCMKRAELIFKCVKGFMMESLAWDGKESRTLQFVVPQGISEELFLGFSSMLPTIFRVSTTLDLSNLNVS